MDVCSPGKGWTDPVDIRVTGQVVFRPDSVPRALAKCVSFATSSIGRRVDHVRAFCTRENVFPWVGSTDLSTTYMMPSGSVRIVTLQEPIGELGEGDGSYAGVYTDQIIRCGEANGF